MNEFFEIFTKYVNRPEHPESYITMCWRMSYPENAKDLANNEDFKKLLLSKRHFIIDSEDPNYLIDSIKYIRESENYPKSHFWWWIDELK